MNYYICLFVCITCVEGDGRPRTWMWRSENNWQESVLSLHHADPGDSQAQRQVPYPLN